VKLHVALANIRLRHDTLFKMKVLCNHIALLKLTNFISTGKLYLKHSATYSSSPLLARIRMRLKFMDLILLWMFSLNDRVNILTLLCVFCNDIAWLTRGGKEQAITHSCMEQFDSLLNYSSMWRARCTVLWFQYEWMMNNKAVVCWTKVFYCKLSVSIKLFSHWLACILICHLFFGCIIAHYAVFCNLKLSCWFFYGIVYKQNFRNFLVFPDISIYEFKF